MKVGALERLDRTRQRTEHRVLKPVAGTHALVDVVWYSPDPWEADPVRQAFVLSLVRSYGVRLLYVCPGATTAKPTAAGRLAPVHPGPVPIEGVEHLWLLERPSGWSDLRRRLPSRIGRGLAGPGRGDQRRVLEAVWSIGLRRPVLLLEAPGLAGLSAGTGWAVLDRSSSTSAMPASPAALIHQIEATLEERERASDRLPVLYVDHCAVSSGAELALARMLPACHGLKPTVVLAADGPLRAMLQERGIEVQVEPMDERSRVLSKEAVATGRTAFRAAVFASLYSLRLARRLRRSDAELIVTNSLKAALYGGVAGRLAGVPVVWHLRDRIASDYLPAPVATMVRLAARVLPSGVIANSEATLGTLKLTPRARRRLTVQAIGSPCELAADTTLARSPVADGIRGAEGPAGEDRPEGLALGMVGRIAPWKGQDVFLRAFAQAYPKGGARARIVGAPLFGEDDYLDELRLLCIELGVSERVEFVGHSDDVRGELSRMDVAVHASVMAEPFGQAVVEAMAAGCAVVASLGGGPAEVITDGVDGLLTAMGDVDALAIQLRRLGDDPALRLRLGDAATVSARRFAPDLVASEVESAYRLVVGRARHTRRLVR